MRFCVPVGRNRPLRSQISVFGMSELVLDTRAALRPPAPLPRAKALGPIALLRALRNNPLETWTQAHFERPIVTGGLLIGEVAVVSDPAAIRRVLLENVANYRKDSLQRRMLSAVLRDGLLTVEADQWRSQRRTLAPLFAKRCVMSFAPAMVGAADALVRRWQERGNGRVIDVSAEVTEVTLDVLERTIFSDGLGGDRQDVRTAMRTYFDTIGRIDPFDVLGLPDFVPRLGRRHVRPALRFFDAAVDNVISLRRARLAENGPLPRDILTLLLEAQDPETGQGLSEVEVRANVITFIAAGHETTANAITSNGTGGGAWSAPATWTGGVVPGAADDVTIADGDTVTIDTAALAMSVTVGQGTSGVLQWDERPREP